MLYPFLLRTICSCRSLNWHPLSVISLLFFPLPSCPAMFWLFANIRRNTRPTSTFCCTTPAVCGKSDMHRKPIFHRLFSVSCDAFAGPPRNRGNPRLPDRIGDGVRELPESPPLPPSETFFISQKKAQDPEIRPSGDRVFKTEGIRQHLTFSTLENPPSFPPSNLVLD